MPKRLSSDTNDEDFFTVSYRLHDRPAQRKSAVALTDCQSSVAWYPPKTAPVPAGIGTFTAREGSMSSTDPVGSRSKAPYCACMSGQRHDVTLITHLRVDLTSDQVGASSVCTQERENVGERPISPAEVVNCLLYLLVEVSPSRAQGSDETAGGAIERGDGGRRIGYRIIAATAVR